MIAGVRVAFDELLQEVTWMNDATREKAKEKVSIIQQGGTTPIQGTLLRDNNKLIQGFCLDFRIAILYTILQLETDKH